MFGNFGGAVPPSCRGYAYIRCLAADHPARGTVVAQFVQNQPVVAGTTRDGDRAKSYIRRDFSLLVGIGAFRFIREHLGEILLHGHTLENCLWCY
jgi:hypothetical protein